MGFIDFIKKLFRKKKEKDSYFEIKKLKDDKTQFSKLIAKLETDKDKIIKEKEEEGIKDLGRGEDGYWIQINKKLFLFDKEGYDLFKEEFNMRGFNIIIASFKDDYLARENIHNEKIEFFHRFLMNKEVEDFCLDNNCTKNKAIVHHKNFNTCNNRRDNLQVMGEEEHNKIHNRV